MFKLKTLALATATASIIALSPMTAFADDGDTSRQLSEARQEGSVVTAIALNRHLNPFKIDVEVENGTAVLTGEVESDVDRDLAEQVAMSVDGVLKVDNQLTVDRDAERNERDDKSMSQRFNNATTTASVKSKLLWNSNTEGLDINVTTMNGVVTLDGVAQSEEAKDLAGRLAANTDGVRDVKNNITVSAEATTAAKAQNTADDAGDAISDAWITSKVKSTYLLSSNLDGLDITVETKNGQVTLSGTVDTAAEKELAVETARNIRGVTDVNASALNVTR
ncbi:BON domain-containing protein [Halopseudomonas sp.]|jgi:osmotically-inducible protein OsmY|uniref:BON domain-containing protein n=1 Tax=Halopseudomonas sp. TaxID=2901191 RepID=UPI0039E5BC13